MGFALISTENWERREYFAFFKQTVIHMTVQVDITKLYQGLKQNGLRIYPALVYCTANVINRHPDFRHGVDEEGRIGVWDTVHPCYTVPRQDNPALFSMKCTTYSSDFSTFYPAFLEDYGKAEVCGRLLCDAAPPKNICGVSAVPGTHFSAFSFGGDPKTDFTPFVLLGKFVREGERILLPVSGEFAHAVNDGVHVSQFFQEFEATANTLF